MAVLFGVMVGLALGLTGGGGSIFAVPLLIYGRGVNARDAISISLAAVATMSAFGASGALRARLVEYRAGLVFAAGGIFAAPIGVKLSQFVSEGTIVNAFAGLMALVALLMWLKASRDPASAAVVRADFLPRTGADRGPICRFNPDERLRLTAPCSAVLALTGIGTGLLSGFFGVGGGFVIVPALTFMSQMGIHRAVATSLFVITLVALAGAGSVLAEGRDLLWSLTGLFLGGGLVGMFLGQTLARRIAGPALQKLFAAAMLAMASFVFVSKLL
jgi:uncharacterized membrane protein YfcA